MLDQALQRLPGQVEAFESRIAVLQAGDDRQRLGVVVEAAVAGKAAVERLLARVAERRMTEIVAQRAGFREILVKAECPGERAGDLGDLEGVGEPRSVMIALVVDENLRLVSEPAK